MLYAISLLGTLSLLLYIYIIIHLCYIIIMHFIFYYILNVISVLGTLYFIIILYVICYIIISTLYFIIIYYILYHGVLYH